MTIQKQTFPSDEDLNIIEGVKTVFGPRLYKLLTQEWWKLFPIIKVSDMYTLVDS